MNDVGPATARSALSSVRVRFLYSVGANALRALLSLLTGLLVARALNPEQYGDLMYLLGSFVAIRSLLDLGTSNAFYTFLSQRARGRTFCLLYFGWLLLQFAASVLFVAAVFPESMIDRIWLGHSREVVLLALVASFMQQQVWTTIVQLGESARLTVRVQTLGVGIIFGHLVLMITLQSIGALSVEAVLAAISIENAIALFVAPRLLRTRSARELVDQPFGQILSEYWRFCRPLIVIALTSFVYDFADKWLLQRFGGAGQQGFFQIAAQLATVSLLATSSILSIFWKEIAEASARHDVARLARLYRKVSRGLFALAAMVSCFLIPWSQTLVGVLLGDAYIATWPVLALMLLYPIHQSLGQVNAAMFMACERTKDYMWIAVAGQLLSLPVSFLMLAPAEYSGLDAGAYGLALKLVVMNVLLTNVQMWMIARFGRWKYEWFYQVAGIAALLVLGYASSAGSAAVMSAAGPDLSTAQLASALLLGGGAYVLGACVLLWTWPGMAGLGREELRGLLERSNIPLLRRL